MSLWNRLLAHLAQRHIDQLTAELDAENRRHALHDNHVEWYLDRIAALKAEKRALLGSPRRWVLSALPDVPVREQPAILRSVPALRPTVRLLQRRVR